MLTYVYPSSIEVFAIGIRVEQRTPRSVGTRAVCNCKPEIERRLTVFRPESVHVDFHGSSDVYRARLVKPDFGEIL
jgi:hypothetical protein